MYDYLVVGTGLFGATFAYEATKKGYRVLAIDRRGHVGGNVYTETVEDIQVHKYGAHIFHTNDRQIWDYVNQFARFNHFINSPIAVYKGEVYSLPFNMYTFNKMWGVSSPTEASEILNAQRSSINGEPQNLEEQAIRLVGADIYERLIKGYTEKQWGKPCTELPAFIIKRLPVRLTYNNNYFDAEYQGIPVNGYTQLIEEMLQKSEVRLNEDYLRNRSALDALATKVIYSGPIDELFHFCFGPLEYRTLRFETEILNTPNYQGNAVVNYTDRDTPWTRIIEHKWFTFGKNGNGCETEKTVITREFSRKWKPGDEAYYPVNDEINNARYSKYRELSQSEDNLIVGGRLGSYKYYDMDKTVSMALELCKEIL